MEPPRLIATGFALALVVAVAVVGVIGCGASDPGPIASLCKRIGSEKDPVAAVFEQGDALLEGGQPAFERCLNGLVGHPVVVNVWASWCVPCREEFPELAAASEAYRDKVAFLGVNTEDSHDAAATFLADNPVPYPSFSDPDKRIDRSIASGIGLPHTAFYNAAGELTKIKYGAFESEQELADAIELYALER